MNRVRAGLAECESKQGAQAGTKPVRSILWLSILALVFSVCVPVSALAATVTTQLDFSTMATTSNAADGWSWNATTNTLTLNNFSMDYTVDNSDAILLPAGATVILQGSNSIISSGASSLGISTNAPSSNVTMQGPGSLSINAYQPFYASGNITVDNAANLNITATGQNALNADGNIDINSANVKLSVLGDYMTGLSAFGMVTIEGSTNLTINATGAGASGIQAGSPGVNITGGTTNITSLGDPTSLGIYAFGDFTISGGVLNIDASANGIDGENTSFTGGVSTIMTSGEAGAWAVDGDASLTTAGMSAAAWDGTNYTLPVAIANGTVYATIFGDPSTTAYYFVLASDSSTVTNVRIGPNPAALLNYNTINYLNGATLSDTTKVAAGTALGNLPAAPSKPGYTFLGWYTAASGGTEISETTVPTADTSYYAHWAAMPVTSPAPPTPAPTPGPAKKAPIHLPDTGEASHLLLWVGLAVAALALLSVLAISYNKNKQTKSTNNESKEQ